MLRPEYPLGLCQAGCGEATECAPKSDRVQGWMANRPKMFCSTRCAQQLSRVTGVSRVSMELCAWFVRLDELERDAVEVRDLLGRVEACDAEGCLSDGVRCRRCGFLFACVVQRGALRLMLRCLDCGESWRVEAAETLAKLADAGRRASPKTAVYDGMSGEMIRLYESGLSVSEVAGVLGLSASVVYRRLPRWLVRCRGSSEASRAAGRENCRLGRERQAGLVLDRGRRVFGLREDFGWSWVECGVAVGLSEAGARHAYGRFVASLDRVAAA